MIIDSALAPITIGGGSPSPVYLTLVVETTQMSAATAIIKATASNDEDAATIGVATAESMSLESANEVVTVLNTTTRTVTVVFFSSSETLPLLTSSD